MRGPVSPSGGTSSPRRRDAPRGATSLGPTKDGTIVLVWRGGRATVHGWDWGAPMGSKPLGGSFERLPKPNPDIRTCSNSPHIGRLRAKTRTVHMMISASGEEPHLQAVRTR